MNWTVGGMSEGLVLDHQSQTSGCITMCQSWAWTWGEHVIRLHKGHKNLTVVPPTWCHSDTEKCHSVWELSHEMTQAAPPLKHDSPENYLEKNGYGDINFQAEREALSVPLWRGVSEDWMKSGWQIESGLFLFWSSITTRRRDRAVVTGWQEVCGAGQQRPGLIWQYDVAAEVQ